MDIYTIQIGKWRKAEALGYELLNTSVMNGELRLAPTWELVRKWKSGLITEADYTTEYLQLMRKSFMANQSFWLGLAEKEVLVLGCYCPGGAFCHRRILADILVKLFTSRGLTVSYRGEIE